MSDMKRDIDWLMKRVKIAEAAMKDTFPDLSLSERVRGAVAIACSSDLSEDLQRLADSVDRIDCGGEGSAQ